MRPRSSLLPADGLIPWTDLPGSPARQKGILPLTGTRIPLAALRNSAQRGGEPQEENRIRGWISDAGRRTGTTARSFMAWGQDDPD